MALPNLYAILPAQTSGDHWHLGAASRLHQEYKDQHDGLQFNFVVVVLLCEGALYSKAAAIKKYKGRGNWKTEEAGDVHLKQWEEQRSIGKTTFNYLRNIGVPVMPVVIDNLPARRSASSTPEYLLSTQRCLEWYIHEMKSNEAKLDAMYAEWRRYHQGLQLSEYPSFDEIVDRLKWTADFYGFDASYDEYPNPTPPLEGLFLRQVTRTPMNFMVMQKPGSRVLRYYTATTLAMQLLDVDPQEKAERLAFLRIKLGSYAKEKGQTSKLSDFPEEAAKMRFCQLLSLVDIKKDGRIPDVIYLYNHRQALYNRQTDSNLYILDSFIKAVGKAPRPDGATYAIVVINSTNHELTSTEVRDLPVFDLFNRNEPESAYPGINPLITSRFWRICAASFPRVFGLFSSRSGSADIAAFNGMNVFFWDEPTVYLAARDPDALKDFGLAPEDFLGVELKNIQEQISEFTAIGQKAKTVAIHFDLVTQSLRCQQLAVVAAMGLPSATSGLKEPWKAISPSRLARWLAGEFHGNDSIEKREYVRCPESMETDGYNFKNWLYWTNENHVPKWYGVAWSRQQFESKNEVGPFTWSIKCSAMHRMGYVFDEVASNVL